MRIIKTAFLVAAGLMLVAAPSRADWVPPMLGNTVPPFYGNDTGGIIAYEIAQHRDARQIAVDHCASYGKVVKFLAVDAQYGGYVSFSCRWVPYGANVRPLRTLY
jgi:hypothetical protein